VKAVPNSHVKELVGGAKLEAVVLENDKTGETTKLASDGIFIEIGYVAKTEFVKGLVRLNSRGEVEVDSEGKTSNPGTFAAGDVTDTLFKQAVISAAQGSIASLSAYNYIQRLRGKTAARADWRSITPLVGKGA
jgi:thioredoxin reductase (NADPH)